jgi:outer membrane receptor protein involved in Fe transport
MLLNLGEVSLRAAAYSGLRLPTLNELYRPFVVFPVTTLANDALRPEIVHGIEAGAGWQPAPGARINVTLFANQLRHAIANVTIGPNVRRRDNVDAIRVYGVEADTAAKLGPFNFSTSLAFNNSRVRDDRSLDGKRPAQTPQFSGSATLGWSSAKTRIAATLRHVGAQFEDDLNTDRLPPATTLGLFAEHALSPHVTLNARAENLFDERVVTRDQDGSIDLGQPRTFWIGFKLTKPHD